MDNFIIFLSFYLYGSIMFHLGELHFVYPKMIDHVWKPVDINTLECTNPWTDEISEFKIKDIDVVLTRPRHFNNRPIKGYLCHKYSLQSICDQNLVFISTESRVFQNRKISVNDCKERIKSLKNDDIIIEEYPEYSCRWNQRVISENYYVHIEKHDVIYDPYNGAYLDPLFLSGKTVQDYSLTKYDSMVWVSDGSEPPELCTDMEEFVGSIYFTRMPDDIRLDQGATLSSQHIIDKTFNGSCRMKYCSQSGIRFKDGEWIAIRFEHEEDQKLYKYIDILPLCPSDTEISTAGLNPAVENNMQMILNEMWNLQCLDTITKIRNRHVINHNDLSIISRSTPGYGQVYKLVNTTLLGTSGLYLQVNTTKLNKKPNQLGEYPDGTECILGDIQKLSEGIAVAPNGIFIVNGLITIPWLMRKEYRLDEEMTREISLHPIHHPTLQNITDRINITDNSISSDTDTIHVIEDKIGFITQIGITIGHFIVKILLCVGALIMIYLVLRLVYYCYVKPRLYATKIITGGIRGPTAAETRGLDNYWDA
uniref:Glycoprotein n=1 Tax=Zeugodacus cucurbitae sigmavirus-B2 TaxID=3159479 RepID=A0AAU7L0I7_9RHAB